MMKTISRLPLFARLATLLFLVAAMSAPVRAELVIRITEGAEDAIPVAVVPFGETGNLSFQENVASIVRSDLSMTGEFSPLSVDKMLSLPSRGKDIFFRDWRLLGQKYVLVGELSPVGQGERVSARFELYDVNRQERLLGETATVARDNLRTLAHHISDRVYQTITGNRGVFSTRLAYVTLEQEQGEPVYRLHVSDVDGQRSRVRLKSDEPILSPAWSPDGRKLAYVSFETGRPAVYIHELASGQREKISSFPGLNSAPAWSPDGDALLLTLSRDGNAEVYKMDIASRRLTRMTNHWAIDTEPSWSSAGSSFVFTSDRSGGPQIYRMDADGGEPQRLTFGSRYNARPRLGPDGDYVFYVHQREGQFSIARLNLNNREEVVLTRTGSDESPSLAPNGRLLIYATQKDDEGVLAVVTADGESTYTLPARFGEVRDPAWSPWTGNS
ncbi:TolB protein [Tamilnaduibacter salinus]|uniref:Tol-Pal system protein TolB n=1 Tax=Tamilnaduibacter salinus TaxID=1484056 RepID=A0A2A2I6E2_9GAMM|nr:Tol-Pal system beta propeller repeat protein TolB [Tamilnaduibacter salinus]PAV26948.1 Tol-Pal system beta propeller repeat protein TolB [Tamilnaduibacter salinus]PVY78352.1 TolB protein [Tamilnaduibacter salinus]